MKKTREELLKDSLEIAKENTPKEAIFFNIGIEKAKELAVYYKADLFIITVGSLLMDIKLQEARRSGKIKEHIDMSVDFSREFLSNYDISHEEYKKIICCIREHHSTVHTCLESEIVANADCYRFLYPISVFSYLKILIGRGQNILEALQQVRSKLDEKYQVLTLSRAKEELQEYYNSFEILLKNMEEDYAILSKDY